MTFCKTKFPTTYSLFTQTSKCFQNNFSWMYEKKIDDAFVHFKIVQQILPYPRNVKLNCRYWLMLLTKLFKNNNVNLFGL